MQKSQILIITLAIALVVGMYSLPKVIVSDKEKLLATGNPMASNDSLLNETHTTNLSEAQVTVISQLRNAFLTSADKEKKITFADSLAVLFKQASQFDSAAFYRESIAQLNPEIQTWINAGDGYYDAFNFATDAQKANKMGEKAREFYQKVIEKDPNQLSVKANIAMTYVATSNPMQGIALLREVLQQDPQNELAMFNLGLLSMQSGQYDRAIERFTQILKQNPANNQAKFYLGISYAEGGHSKEAKELLQQVKSSNPDPVVQSTVDEYLKKLK
jgi:tetratricopeptide (TPR) repeat protein